MRSRHDRIMTEDIGNNDGEPRYDGGRTLVPERHQSFETEPSPLFANSAANNDGDEEDGSAFRFHRDVDDGIDNQESTAARVSRCAIGVGLATVLICVICDSTSIGGHHLERWTHSFVGWLSTHPIEGMGAVILVYIVATVLFVPGSLLTFGTGYAFGVACSGNVGLGILLSATSVFIGASLGSICSFLLGRYLFRGCVFRLAASYPIFRAINGALEGNGLKIMILLRLSPLIPYNALDYISGVTSISLSNYTLALFGILPGTIALCAVGASASSLGDHDGGGEGNKVLRVVSIVAGVVFAAAGVYVASYYSKKELDRILESERGGIENLDDNASSNASDANSEDSLVPHISTANGTTANYSTQNTTTGGLGIL